MGFYSVEESGVVEATPEAVYRIIADYHEGHRAILPARYFEDLRVTDGGFGAGTTLFVAMNVFGSKSQFNLTVSEPEPGRVLEERDDEAGLVTRFTVEPIEGQQQTRVTIATRARTSSGLRGFLEKLFTPSITRRIYREELANLAAYVQHSEADSRMTS